MKGFSFRLESVLEYKQDQLEMLQNDYVSIMDEIAQQEKKIQQMKEKKKRCQLDFDAKKTEGITPIEAVNCQNYLEQQEYLLRKEQDILEQMKKKEKQKKEELLESKKETLSMEKLKDIRFKEYQKASSRETELLVEEFVSNRQSLKKE